METFSALLAICAGNSSVTGEFPAQGPVPRSFDVFFDLRLNKRLIKWSWGRWFETPYRPLWRHYYDQLKVLSTEMLSSRNKLEPTLIPYALEAEVVISSKYVIPKDLSDMYLS